ncbi:hypothetical protein FB446DRAFT_637544, partial [Lentinula raphanica]
AASAAALIMYIKFQVPVRQMRVILSLLRSIVRAVTKAPTEPNSHMIPKDIHTIVSRYDLAPNLHTFVVCSECHALSHFSDDALRVAETAHKMNQSLPVCDQKSHPDSLPCGAALWRTRSVGNRTFVTPVRKQVFQNLKDWVGRILAIPGIEDIITQHQQRSPPAEAEPERDFVDSATFRQFKGADGQPYSVPQLGPSGSLDLRLVMSLGFDAFNPFQSKESHATYMYLVTIIPGKPSKHHINHTLRILVEQLLPFWTGVFYMRTARYFLGRRVFIALIPAVCDTEGATQLAGFASHAHTYFCRRCVLPLSDIHNLDPKTWVMRDLADHRTIALKWKEATSEVQREAIYKQYGLRWSELLELPYWDPIRFTVIDDMHLGYLGLFETHLRDIWMIDHKTNGGNGLHPETREQIKLSKAGLRKLLDLIPPAPNFIKDAAFERLKTKLLSLSQKLPALKNYNKTILQALCHDLGIGYRTEDSKKILITRLMLHVRRQEHRDSKLKPELGSTPRHVIGKDLLTEVWLDMDRTILPSWIQKPPSRWGTPAAGKLSADEYKVIASISMVITLIRIWGYENEGGAESRRYKMLQNYLDLIHAIHVLFLRETTQHSRAYYRSHMLRYLRTLLELYPDITLKSNHHLSIHIVTDLEMLGPGHARSSPIFERTNHSYQEVPAKIGFAPSRMILCPLVKRFVPAPVSSQLRIDD